MKIRKTFCPPTSSSTYSLLSASAGKSYATVKPERWFLWKRREQAELEGPRRPGGQGT
jgi:hypothetical protein